MEKNNYLKFSLALGLVLASGLCNNVSSAEAPADIEQQSQANSHPSQVKYVAYEGEGEDVIRKKEEGILEDKRDYTQKSGFVKDRDEVEGRIKEAGKKLFN